jgi:hypothetical protein
MFECFKDGVSYGLRCEDCGVAWRDYLIRAGKSAGLHQPGEDGYCVDCAAAINGVSILVDLDQAMDVFLEMNSDTYFFDTKDKSVWWRNSFFRNGFLSWLNDTETVNNYVFEFDRGEVNDLPVASFTVDECHLIRTALLDVSLALTISGNKLPYDVDVFSSVVNKLGEVGR